MPTNSPGVPFIFDAGARVGMCGDWLLGSSIEAACLSGEALANHIEAFAEQGGPSDASLGLTTPLKPIKSAHNIGSFPAKKAAQAEPVSSAVDSMPGLKPKPVWPRAG